jgi:hypothetical protein
LIRIEVVDVGLPVVQSPVSLCTFDWPPPLTLSAPGREIGAAPKKERTIVRRNGVTFGFLLLAVCSMATLAQGNTKITKGTAQVIDGETRTLSALAVETFHGGLLVSFQEVGLGSTDPTDYVVSAGATATYACVNSGGNNPKASNKTTVTGPVSGGASFTADAGGNLKAQISIPPLGPGTFSCPSGQTLILASVSYTNVRITDVTNNVYKDIPGTYSLTLVTIK